MAIPINYRKKADKDAERMRQRILDYLMDDPERVKTIIEKTRPADGLDQKITIPFENKLRLPRLKYNIQNPISFDDDDEEDEEDQEQQDKGGAGGGEPDSSKHKEADTTQEGDEGADQAGDAVSDSKLEFKLSDIINRQIEEYSLPLEKIGAARTNDKMDEMTQIERRGYRQSTYDTIKRNLIRSMALDEDLPIDKKKDAMYYVLDDKKVRQDAVVIYTIDTSGSMGPNQLQLVKNINYILTMGLAKKYPKLISEYIVFDFEPSRVSGEDLFNKGYGGGTNFSKTLDLIYDISQEYRGHDIFVIFSSDSQNDFRDNTKAQIALNKVLDEVSMMYYVHCKNASKDTDFFANVRRTSRKRDNLHYGQLYTPETLGKAIKHLLEGEQ